MAQYAPTGQGEAASSGQQLMVAAARQLSAPALSAKVLHRVRMMGQKLEGATGQYHQLGGGSGMARLELKLAIGDKVSSFLQVCDGRFLYVRRELPEQKSLTRIDLEQVRAALAASGKDAPAGAAASWMALGGLSQFLTMIEQKLRIRPAAGRQAEQYAGVGRRREVATRKTGADIA